MYPRLGLYYQGASSTGRIELSYKLNGRLFINLLCALAGMVMPLYCENCKKDSFFKFQRTPDGTVWVCIKCGFKILDLAKYPFMLGRQG